MHKSFYASGFIFHQPSQKILLQQNNSANSFWTMFEDEYSEENQPESVFKNTVLKSLDLKINKINPIYTYLDESTKKTHTLLYATIGRLQEFPPKNNYTFRWFTFKEILKIRAAEQTKHDIVVGQRVIEAARRKVSGEHTL